MINYTIWENEKFLIVKYVTSFMRIPFLSKINEKINAITNDLNILGDQLVNILDEANKNIAMSLEKSTEDIRETSNNIAMSAESMAESLSQTSAEIKETAENIAKSADFIAEAVKNFTLSTTETISRFENAIERSVERLVSTIEDFKREMVQEGIKVNIAKSAISLVPRPQTGIMQGITTGIRDMIIPKRKTKDDEK